WQPDQDLHVAIIGTRQPTPQGAAVAQTLACKLAEQGHMIVSGLALGVDSQAHRGALRANGRTIAVLGSGVLRVYPHQHQALAHEIEEAGALVSEVAPTASASSARLVARNRIISGLSSAVIVIETADDGGAMHAARRAREQGRPLYVLDCNASGNRELLAAGALPFHADLHDFPTL
ncbi:MAG: DNA-protecting protein DprA, partial [Anaerolineae bacterium]|nr:DNA-protecting protein DprA [Anaerolineae bacterium]